MSTKDWLEKDYYKVLGVSKDAKPAEIKKAFRKIARENHPDQHPGDKKAEQRFKDASEAHDVLSDADKRKEYDQARSLMGGGGFRFQRSGSSAGGPSMDDVFRTMGGSDTNISDLFSGLFGASSTGSAATFRRSTPRTARRGSDVEGKVSISFEDAVAGVTVGVKTVSEEPCKACRGTGAKSGTVPKVCPTCQGSGVKATGGLFGGSEPCPDCHGRGLIVTDPCPVCHGSGRATSDKTMQVRIPAGVADGQRIRLKGKGSPGENGGTAGDLYVSVQVKAHRIFGRKADNLTVTVPITYPEAVLGAQIEVPTLQGMPVKLKVPPDTPNGRTFRVRGKGILKTNGETGDLLVTVEVTVPKTISPQARAELQKYADSVGEPNPRTEMLARA